MSTSNKIICNDGASKSQSNNDGVCEVVDMLHNMSTADDNIDSYGISNICANCGKEGSDVVNTCNKCMMVKYCNAACKKKHRHKHKKECEEHVRLAAEHAAELHDEQLFKQPPPLYEDCPICFLRMPTHPMGSKYNSCCGKLICSGCFYANANINLKKQLCAFCRTPNYNSEKEAIERTKKRVKAGDSIAIYNTGCRYANGEYALPQNQAKALELYHQAGKLGHALAYYNIGNAYIDGNGVELDKKKAIHYYELAAMKGHVIARHNLGYLDEETGNVDRAVKHYMMAARSGFHDSLNNIRFLFKDGHATKEEYLQALQYHQEYLNEVKSSQRDEAAAYDDTFKYY